MDRGRVLRQSGDLAGALNQFTRALQIDPGNEAAAQEIKITQRQDKIQPVRRRRPPGTRGIEFGAARCGEVSGADRAEAGVERSDHAAHGGGHQEHLHGDRQDGGAECAVRSGLLSRSEFRWT